VRNPTFKMKLTAAGALAILSFTPLAAASAEPYAEQELYAREADAFAEAEAEAYYTDQHEIFARDAEADPYAFADADAEPWFDEYEHALYAREAEPNPEADPEAFFSDEDYHELVAREAEAEANAFVDYEDHELYAREAYPEPEANPAPEAAPAPEAEAEPFFTPEDLPALNALHRRATETALERRDAEAEAEAEANAEADPLFGMKKMKGHQTRHGYSGVCKLKTQKGALWCMGVRGLVFPRTPCQKVGAYCNSDY